MSEKDCCIVKIGGIAINSTSLDRLLRLINQGIDQKRKTLIVTPNPEFIIFAQKHLWFKKILNSAHFSLPDGIGLVLASRLLANGNNTIIKERIAGSDLVAKLLDLANQNHWSAGIVGARRGEKAEKGLLFGRLQNRYPQVRLFDLDNPSNLSCRSDRLYHLIFACQGMGEQEKWIDENFKKIPGLVFIGSGGSLDFLTGFTKRAPWWMRKTGFEWLWRICQRPSHFRRAWRAVVEFGWLVFKERLAD